jgi:thymidylate synthase
MRILTIVQGIYGQRITANIQHGRDPAWTVESWQAPRVLPPIIDYPEEFVPPSLPPADLLISLGEHPGVAELLPDLVRLCGAKAAIVPVDNVAWLPPGLMNQLARWLADLGVAAVFPKPFCSLTATTCGVHGKTTVYDVPLVAQFAQHFGRPELVITFTADASIAGVELVRDSPCGCVNSVAQGLPGVGAEYAESVAGMRHHHYPCLASMAIDSDYSDTLMHVSGHLLRDEVARHVKTYRGAPVYLRPQGRSD